MFQLTSLLLCDAAAVRENLLHVLGGGLTIVLRPAYPAPLGVDLALVLETAPGEDDERSSTIQLEIVHVESGHAVVETEFGVGIHQTASDAWATVPLAITLRDVVVPAPGGYEVRIGVDGTPAGTLHVTARQVPAE